MGCGRSRPLLLLGDGLVVGGGGCAAAAVVVEGVVEVIVVGLVVKVVVVVGIPFTFAVVVELVDDVDDGGVHDESGGP